MNFKNENQKICIVIPCYNEQNRLPINKFIDNYNSTDYFYLFVNDGSTDLTNQVLNQFKNNRESRVKIIENVKNQGKGESIRLGVLTALEWDNFSIIGYVDADLAMPLSEVPYLINYIDDDVSFVFGSRFKRIGSIITRKLYRHLIGRLFASIVSNMLRLGVYDTQCGAKFFRADIVKNLFSDKFLTKWVFDVEIFFRFIQSNKNINIHKIAKEIPLNIWIDIAGSKIKLKHLFLIPFELLSLLKYLK